MAERRESPRYRVVLPAICFGQARPDFYAVTDDVSAHGIRFKSATSPRIDETLTCRIRHVGAVEAQVLRIEAASFVVRVLTRRPAADRIARELLLVARKQTDAREPIRVHARIVPRKRDVRVVLDDGSVVTAAIMNVSASGVGLFLDPLPAVGTPVTIGSTAARVARRFDGGVGAIFVRPFDPSAITDAIVL